MFCKNCGKNIRDDATFCPHCGAANSPAFASGSASGASYNTFDTTSASPAGGKKRRGVGLIVGGAVAAVAVMALLVVAVSSLFSSPAGKVEKAFAKTVSAYSDAYGNLGLPDLDKLSESRSVSQRLSLELNSINEQLTGGYDLSALAGLGLRMSTDLNCKERKMDAEFAAYWDEDDIVNIQLLVDDNNMYVGAPQFLDDFLGLNTKTLGADLEELADGEDLEGLENISFNLFDLVDLVAPEGGNAETEKAAKEAQKALLKSLEVEKTGSETIEVNGKSTKTTAYHVVITQDALEEYVDAMEDVMKSVDYFALYKDVLKEMGMPKELIDEVMSEMDDVDFYGQMADMYKELLDEIGDVELDVYLSGGYVSAVRYEDKIDGTKMEISLYLGGGDQYVDNLSLVIEGNGTEVSVESSGNHAGKGGTFTDETVLRVKRGSETLGRITSEMSYEPKKSSNNLQWDISVDSNGTAVGSLSIEGQLTAGKDSLELLLDDISVKAMGMKLVSLSAEYSVGPCEGMTVKAGSPVMLAEMDEDDFLEIAYDAQRNMEDWTEDMQQLIIGKLPQELLWALVYMF